MKKLFVTGLLAVGLTVGLTACLPRPGPNYCVPYTAPPGQTGIDVPAVCQSYDTIGG